MNRKITETPHSKVSIIDLKTVRGYTSSFVLICHTRDMESLKKTLHYIVDQKEDSNINPFIFSAIKVKEHQKVELKSKKGRG